MYNRTTAVLIDLRCGWASRASRVRGRKRFFLKKEAKTFIYKTVNTPIEPRAAASVLVVRDNTVLMARRAAGHRFMPNMLVFPGGAVDPADYHATAATPLSPGVLAKLTRSADASLAHALGIAAARELLEEVSLSLGAPPALGHLHYLCRAITPPDRSIRFDARFFVVDARYVTGAAAGSAELEDPRWYSVADALHADIPPATRAVLGEFERWHAHQNQDTPVRVLENRIWHDD